MGSEIVVVEGQSIEKKEALSNIGQFVLPQNMIASVQEAACARAVEILAKIMTAMSAPRDEKIFLAVMLEKAKDEAFAEKAVSIKPIGKGIESPSVHLAKEMAREFGHIKWASTDHGSKPGDKVSQVQARVIDYQKNMEAEVTVPVRHQRKAAESKGGAILDVVDPAEINTMSKVETSKTLRNALFSMMPPGAREQIFEACIATLDKSAAVELNNKEKAVKTFCEDFKVKPAQIFNLLRIDGPDKLQAKHVRRLRLLYKAVLNGELNPADLFDGAENRPVRKQRGRQSEQKAEETTAPEGKDAEKSEASNKDGEAGRKIQPENRKPPADIPKDDQPDEPSKKADQDSDSDDSGRGTEDETDDGRSSRDDDGDDSGEDDDGDSGEYDDEGTGEPEDPGDGAVVGRRAAVSDADKAAIKQLFD